jgi:hypothetical protein
VTRRWIALIAILCVLTVPACARSGDVEPMASGGKYGSGVDLEGLDGDAKPAPGNKTGTTSAGSSSAARSAPVPSGAQVGSQPGPAPQNVFASDNGGTGRNASLYLRDTPYTRLVIELTAVKGAEPEPAALEYLKTRLTEVVDKARGVQVLPVKTFAPTKDVYDTEDFAQLEDKYRRSYSGKTGGDVVLHYLFLNGKHKSGVLGVAWRASSIAIFTESIEAISDQITLTPVVIQRAVFLHEAGHNLALLNFGYQSTRERWDPKNRTHSANKDSVMYYAIEHGSNLVENFLGGTPPQTFDADDLADLADIRSGKLKPYGI